MSKIVIVGAGIVGLAVGHALAGRGDEVVVLEKESGVARHQTGRNSGVIHSGLYYKPGSLKARMSVAGARSIQEFARENGVDFEICGKLVVATQESEIPQLEMLHRRGQENGVPCRMVTVEEAREIEPHVACVAALKVETTGIIDYKGVSEALARGIEANGGEVRTGAEVKDIVSEEGRRVRVVTEKETLEADAMVNCAGLYSDRIAIAAGLVPEARIVPFRGEYFELVPEKEHLVKGLIYPVPDPRFPFLGVHLTKMVKGGVHAGPNAVLALAREGYTWGNIKPKELLESLAWPGLWRLGAKNMKPGIEEIRRSLSKEKFTQSLQELVPEVRSEDLIPSAAGVRAQALLKDGSMVDDFLIQTAPRQVHVLNSPSPAATGALEIAKDVVREVDGVLARS